MLKKNSIIFYFIIVSNLGLLIMFSCNKVNHSSFIKISKDSLVFNPNNGILHYKKKAFTGISIQKNSNDFIIESIDYSNGKKQGKYILWFNNGIKSFESEYQKGKRHGKTSTWWENGNLRSVANYKNGIVNGLQQQWYRSGALFKQMNLINGKEQGLQQSWRENGKLYNNYEAKNGRIFGLKRSKLCYELENESINY